MSMLPRPIVAVFLVAALAGCEISSELAARSEPPPAEGKPYPNLASVPPNPRCVQPAATEAQLRQLEVERAAAREADAKLRAAAIPDQPSPPVQLAPVGPRGVSAVAPTAAAAAAPAGQGGAILNLEFA